MIQDFAPLPLSDVGRAALLDFARAALPFIRARAPGGRIPLVTITRTMFSDTEARHWEESVSVRSIEAIRFDAGIYRELLALPSIAPAVRTLWEQGQLPEPKFTDSAGKPITGKPFEELLSSLGQLPLDAVRKYALARGSLDGELDPQGLEAAFVAVQAKCVNVEIDLLASAPLKYFNMDAPRVEFPDGAAIERMSGADKANLWSDDYLDYSFTKAELADTWYRLTLRYRRTREQAISHADAEKRFDRILSALRLVQPGHVEAPTLVVEEVPREPPSGMSGGSKFRDTTSLAFFKGKQYRFDLTQVPELIRIDGLLGGVRAGGVHRAFDLALRRFNQSFQRGEPEDSIIDLAIALESTLLAGQKDELRFRLALRGAALLREKHDPREVYGFLLKMYDARSAIVHNGFRLHEMKKDKLGTIPPHAFAPTAQQVVRLVLLRCLELLSSGESLNDLSNSLDQAVLTSLSPQPPTG
jgi:hypothetical protein